MLKHNKPRPPCCASLHHVVSRNWRKMYSGRPMVTPHLPWKFHANRSSRLLLMLTNAEYIITNSGTFFLLNKLVFVLILKVAFVSPVSNAPSSPYWLRHWGSRVPLANKIPVISVLSRSLLFSTDRFYRRTRQRHHLFMLPFRRAVIDFPVTSYRLVRWRCCHGNVTSRDAASDVTASQPYDIGNNDFRAYTVTHKTWQLGSDDGNGTLRFRAQDT